MKTPLGWEVIDTGGGCLKRFNRPLFKAGDAEQPCNRSTPSSPPTGARSFRRTPEEPVILGLHAADDPMTQVACWICDSTAAAVQIIASMLRFQGVELEHDHD